MRLRFQDQTILSPETGNCFAACVATILGYPLADLPNFCHQGMWWMGFQRWLDQRGLVAIEVNLQPAVLGTLTPGVPCILTGASPNNPGKLHSVVGVTAEDGFEYVHDPNPARKYLLGEPKHVLFFAALRPQPLFRRFDGSTVSGSKLLARMELWPMLVVLHGVADGNQHPVTVESVIPGNRVIPRVQVQFFPQTYPQPRQGGLHDAVVDSRSFVAGEMWLDQLDQCNAIERPACFGERLQERPLPPLITQFGERALVLPIPAEPLKYLPAAFLVESDCPPLEGG
jgi:hypothetical protein